MKVFIVFLAVLLIAVGFFLYEGDLSAYLRMENYLKNLAEEASIAAAMYYDESFYGQGIIVLSRTEGEKAVGYLVDKANEALRGTRDGILSYTLELYDSEKGFDRGETMPSSKVTLTYLCEDLFRLPFLRVTEITRQGKYQVKGY